MAVLREADSARLGLTQGGPEGAIAICCYRGMSSINILVSKQEASQLMEKINFAMESARGNTGESAGAAPSGSNA